MFTEGSTRLQSGGRGYSHFVENVGGACEVGAWVPGLLSTSGRQADTTQQLRQDLNRVEEIPDDRNLAWSVVATG